MNLAEYRYALRIDLKGVGGANPTWQDSELNRCVEKSVDDVSRFAPLEKVYEVTLAASVSAESFTSASAAGTYVALTYKPIKKGSETVTTDPAGTTYARDTDYTMDYTNGKITHISGGSMSNSTGYLITYEKSKIALDVSSLTDLIRVSRIEAPLGNVPQSMITWWMFGDWLYPTTRESTDLDERKSQERFADGQHVVVFYLAEHTAPTATADGTYPLFMDEIVVKGAAAYACYIMSMQEEHQAITDRASARTALTSAGTQLTAAATALAKIATYLEDNTNEDSKYWLTKITTDIAELRTAIETALDAGATYLTDATTPPSAHDYLVDGDDLINVVNRGAEAAALHRDYALAAISIYNGLVREAETRLSNLRSYIEQADGWGRVASGFITEGVQRIAAGRGYVEQAATYHNSSAQCLEAATRWKLQADERRNEFWSILRDRGQYRGDAAGVSPRQAT